MFINSIHFTFNAKDTDTAASSLKELRDASRQQAGVMQYEVGQSIEMPNVFALWKVYRDQEAFAAHAASEPFQRIFVNGIRPMIQDHNIEGVAPI